MHHNAKKIAPQHQTYVSTNSSYSTVHKSHPIAPQHPLTVPMCQKTACQVTARTFQANVNRVTARTSQANADRVTARVIVSAALQIRSIQNVLVVWIAQAAARMPTVLVAHPGKTVSTVHPMPTVHPLPTVRPSQIVDNFARVPDQQYRRVVRPEQIIWRVYRMQKQVVAPINHAYRTFLASVNHHASRCWPVFVRGVRVRQLHNA